MFWAGACLVGELHVPVLHLLDRAKVFRYEHMPRTDLFPSAKAKKKSTLQISQGISCSKTGMQIYTLSTFLKTVSAPI